MRTKLFCLTAICVAALGVARLMRVPSEDVQAADTPPAAAAPKEAPPDPEVEKLGEWMQGYYQHREADKLPAMVALAHKHKIFENSTASGSVVGFFSQLVNEKPERLALFTNWEKPSAAELKTVALISWWSLSETGNKYLAENEPDWTKVPCQGIANLHINRADELDLCWGAFFATGKPAMIEPIIGALELYKYTGSLEAIKKGDQSKQKVDEAILEAVFQAAVWSLTANGRDHDVVKQVLIAKFKAANTRKDIQYCVGMILSQIDPQNFKVEQPKR